MSEHGDMGCERFADVAAELSLGVLTGRERADALAHLEHCDACRETVRQLTMTGEQLLGLLPSVEPPAGFETRVLSRLGIAVPDVPPPAAEDLASGYAAGRAGGRPGGLPAGHSSSRGSEPGVTSRRRRSGRAAKTSPPGHAGPAGRPGSTRGPGRRTLATLVTALAVVVAALGGWGLRGVTAPASQSPLSSAALTSATQQDVGSVYYYNSGTHWLYMSVDMPSGNEMVTCELRSADGRYTTVGKFQLTQGYGAWGSPARWSGGKPAGARLVASDGKVLATATFS
ncbi:MAG TPA: hypothetical protein VK817_26315 [Trebonia sp.]|jgi:hypothetical protein|nr:hypothetical protein [Trebonia sp.]